MYSNAAQEESPGKYKYDIMPLSTYLDVITLVHPLALGSQSVVEQHLRVTEFLREKESPLCSLNGVGGVQRYLFGGCNRSWNDLRCGDNLVHAEIKLNC